MARLNAVLTRDEFYCPHIVTIVCLLMLTGCRFGEIASLEWDWIKDKRIFLPNSKSGPRTVWLSDAPRAVIDAIPRYGEDCPYLFSRRPPTRPVDTIAFHWDRIRIEAGLPGLRLHDLRPRRRATPSCRARTCRSWASCSVTGALRPPRAMPILPMVIWSRRRRKSGA